MTAGIGIEKSWLDGVQHSFTYDLAGMLLSPLRVWARIGPGCTL